MPEQQATNNSEKDQGQQPDPKLQQPPKSEHEQAKPPKPEHEAAKPPDKEQRDEQNPTEAGYDTAAKAVHGEGVLGEEYRDARRFTQQRIRVEYNDKFSLYEWGLDELNIEMDLQQHRLEDLDVLRRRLRENISDARFKGDTSDLQAGRQEILKTIDAVTRQVLNVPFDDLCQRRLDRVSKGDGARDATTRWKTLSLLERCFMLATVVLYESPIYVVSRAALDLYLVAVTPIADTTAATVVQPPDESLTELMAKTGTISRFEQDAERLFWQDDEFGHAMFKFVANEAMGMQLLLGKRQFLDVLSDWATGDDVEINAYAAEVLARILWQKDREGLKRRANEWTAETERQCWQATPSLLAGAYEAERVEQKDAENKTSQIGDLLNRWSNRSDDAQHVRVVAYTYGLIGQHWPTVALDGLDYLLHINADERKETLPFAGFIAGTSTYAILAQNGYVRLILARLAEHMQALARQPRSRSTNTAGDRKRIRRDNALSALFLTFVFLSLSANIDARKAPRKPYALTEALPQQPVIPDHDGRDVLLAGILSSAEKRWREHISTILGVAIAENKASGAFAIMEQWATLIAADTTLAPLFLQFMVELAQQAQRWDRDQAQDKPRVIDSLRVYRNFVKEWVIRSRDPEHPLHTFARALQDAIPAL